MSDDRRQRSFYLTEDQHRWVRVQSASRGITASALVAELIDQAMSPKTTSPAKIKAQGQNIHSALAKIAKP